MKWRKEANSWTNNPLRQYLNLEQRDIYHCLRSLAGDDNGRQGYIERSEGIPYTRKQLASLVDYDETILNQTISKLIEREIIADEKGVLHFTDWVIEQSVPLSYNGKRPSPAQKEAWQRASAIKYLENNLDIRDGLIGDILIKLVNDGKIVYTGEGKSGNQGTN